MKHERQLTVEEIKEIAYSGLERLDTICKEHSLRYCLAYGTLLGAVRHKGFIPWDDDIDVLMPREDYDKLLMLTDEIENDEWELLSYIKTDGYCYPWMKLCNKKTVLEPSRFHSGLLYGIPIDIFPLQTVKGNDADEVLKSVSPLKKIYADTMREIRPLKLFRPGLKWRMVEMYRKLYYDFVGSKKVSIKDQLESLDKELAELSDSKAEYCMNSCDILDVSYSNTSNRIYKKSDFDFDNLPRIQFEKADFCVPRNYANILTNTYGDYMKLPPVEKRVTHHTAKCYFKNV